ncbi:hypothetical protein FHL15_000589 [Xylaria flabelliformis]|uniref:Rhodopsin domain-containing protein n=1 Tax=Xylaria flabelliformis TaxID=2512241 RepID=A0A553IE88_9PEZI|nr:hypothetical protein FHL15_000589 [Xylaria flabelliformis]
MKNIDPAAYPALRTVWIFTGVTSLFVPLRIYIRVKILEGFRKDDFCYVVSFACLFLYAILITNSAEHGLGQDISTITAHPPEEHVKAVLDVIIGQTFLIIGNVASKLSITFFLNHMARQLINNRIHMIALWTPVTLFTIFITAALFISWFPCQPAARLWDPRVDGHCSSDLLPVAYVAGALSAIVDICYAIYPWCLLWKSYRHPQKLVVLLSLSLGVAAAGIGVKRAFELWRLASHNYLKDTPELRMKSKRINGDTGIELGEHRAAVYIVANPSGLKFTETKIR